MKIVVPDVDGRTLFGDMWHEVTDADSGQKIGRIRGHQGSQLFNSPSWEIELFEGRHLAHLTGFRSVGPSQRALSRRSTALCRRRN